MIGSKRFRLALAVLLVAASGLPAAAKAAAPTRLGPSFQVDSRQAAQGAVATSADGSFVVAYVARAPASPPLLFQRYDAAGNALGQPLAVDATRDPLASFRNPKVAINARGQFSVLWYEVPAGSNGVDGAAFRIRSFDSDGRARGPSVDIAPVVAQSRTQIFDASIAVDSTGRTVTSFIRDTVVFQRHVEVPPCSPAVPCFTTDTEYDRTSVVVRRFGAAGVGEPEIIVDDARSFYSDGTAILVGFNTITAARGFASPSVAIDDGDAYAVAWIESRYNAVGNATGVGQASLRLQRYNAAGASQGQTVSLAESTDRGSQQLSRPTSLVLTSAATGYGLAWLTFTTTSTAQLLLLDRAGQPRGAVLAIPSTDCGAVGLSASSSPAGLIALGLLCVNRDNSEAVRAYRVAADGTALGIFDVAVAASTQDEESLSDVSASVDAAGKLVVVWTDNTSGRTVAHQLGQRYGAQ